MAKAAKTRCGMVAIVGRPNAGKSTLLNNIVGEKIAIVTQVPQTTRNPVRGIYTDERGQIIFIDTPGLHHGADKLDQFMNKSASGTLDTVDCIIYLVDTSRLPGEEEKLIAGRLKNVKVPIILGLNKIDLKRRNVDEYISFWEDVQGKKVDQMEHVTLLPLSGAKDKNIDKLIDLLFECLPDGPPLYPDDTVCDVPQRMCIADIIREKLFKALDKEIPHSLGVFIEEMRSIRNKTTNIKVLIYVERDSQKEIVIGKNGSVLKKAGTLARKELEELLETKVYLECHVKTHKGWRDDASLLLECGFNRP